MIESIARTQAGISFTQAADEYHVAQPSRSRAIGKLEQELSGDLFRRERSLTHLSELGRVMLPMLAQSYQTALSAKSRLSFDETPSARDGTVLPAGRGLDSEPGRRSGLDAGRAFAVTLP